MKLNIEKLKEKLNSINSEVVYFIERQLNNKTKDYYTLLMFNNVISMTLSDIMTDNDIDNFYLYVFRLRIKDFDNIRKTLDFIEANEQAIKTAMLESIEAD